MRDTDRKTEEKLKEAEECFRSIFDNNSDGLIVADIESKRIVLVNPAMCRMLGYGEEELKSLRAVDIHPEEDLPHVIEQFQNTAKGKLTITEKNRVQRKDGTLFYADITTSRLTLGGKECLMGAFRDVTWRKQAEEDIRRINEKLEQTVEERTRQLVEAQKGLVQREKLATIGFLAGNVANELLNPLGVVSNAIYFLKMTLADADTTVKGYLDMIKQEIGNSEKIVSDLLDFARTKSPQPRAVTARELITEIVDKCVVPDNVIVNLDIPEMLPKLKIDPLQIGQVFQNLITNAVQAMPKGGALRITARRVSGSRFMVQGSEEKLVEPRTFNVEPDADFVEISVEDTGKGISPENMKKLFQPLFTTKPRGIGLGLVVCRNLVAANGGRIEVVSHLDEGTTFTVTLPTSPKE
jgi:PAS domain S-box-containing protein